MTRKITSFLLTVIVAVTGFCVSVSAESKTALDKQYDRQMAQLTSLLEQDSDTVKAAEKLGRKFVFLSASNGTEQAVTVYASGGNLQKALDRVLQKAKDTKMPPVWLKLDVVTEIEEISYKDFREKYAGKNGGSMRRGIAFNNYFGRALLEAQVSSGGYINYETGELDLARINTYFKKNKKKQFDAIPETLYLFKAQGYFTDGQAYRLTNGKNNDTGRRDYVCDKEGLVRLAEKTSSYFSGICGEDGKFVYGYYPIDNEEISGYNIIRHGGAVWNLILLYDMTRDEELLPVIERALGYLERSLHYKDKKTAFLSDGKVLNVGGNGISLLAFTSYAEIMKSDKFNDVIEALSNGIIYMQKESGGFTHTIKVSDYSVAKDYVIVYYDGEAMYGMLKAYGVLKKPEFLRSAEKAADYFIANKYEELNSHWISYAFNELTKYSPKPEYFSFGLKNVGGDYLKKALRNVTGSPTRGETLGAAYELYDRLLESGIKCEGLEEFDGELLVQAFEKRVSYGLNYFMFPEYAMYFKNPQSVLNSFSIKEDLFRIRIDDIQHFMGGYYLYWKNYDKLSAA